MKKLLLFTGLLVALLGLIRSVDAIPVGYGSTEDKKIRMINLVDGSTIASVFDGITYNIAFQGLAIDNTAEFLYGSDQNAFLYKINIGSGALTTIGHMDLNKDGFENETVEAMDFGGLFGTDLLVTDVDASTANIYKINTSTAESIELAPFPMISDPTGGAVRAMAVNTNDSNFPFETEKVWISSDGFPINNFKEVNITDGSVNPIGAFDDPEYGLFNELNLVGRITGMDRIDGVLYALSSKGGIYRIDDQQSGLLTQLQFGDPAERLENWLALATSELSGPGSSTADPVPEAPTVALLGIGLAGLTGGAIRRKIKNRRLETQPSFV